MYKFVQKLFFRDAVALLTVMVGYGRKMTNGPFDYLRVLAKIVMLEAYKVTRQRKTI